MTEEKNIEDKLLRRPRQPELSECCQRNCENCVFVYFERALQRWKKNVAALETSEY